jgi:hypothetical protein
MINSKANDLDEIDRYFLFSFLIIIIKLFKLIIIIYSFFI